MIKRNLVIASISIALPAGVFAAPTAQAAGGWVAVAGSVSHEQLDWAYGPNQSSAVARALSQCAQLQRADDCVVLASGSECIAIVWDAAQPLNRPHGATGSRPAVALEAATAAAGPTANDPTVRCA